MDYECDKGWYDLINRTIEKIKFVFPECEFSQIKEKFGSLRIYLKSYPEDAIARSVVHDIISIAETNSEITCEVCGSTDIGSSVRPRGGPWIKTLCQKHADELGHTD